MRPAPRTTTTSSFARARRWLYIRALGAGIGLMLALSGAIGADAEASSSAATGAGRHVFGPPGQARASANLPLMTGSGSFGGLTSKGWPVVVRVSRRGQRVTQAVAGIEFTCASGVMFAVSDKWTDLRIRNRRFGATDTGADAEAGSIYTTTDTIKGKLNRTATRIDGTWRVLTVQRNAAGATVDTCDTGPLRFTVRR